jgi:hypothetical protein
MRLLSVVGMGTPDLMSWRLIEEACRQDRVCKLLQWSVDFGWRRTRQGALRCADSNATNYSVKDVVASPDRGRRIVQAVTFLA